MKIPFYQIDAFTSSLFSGNPAGVCLLDDWLEGYVKYTRALEAPTAFHFWAGVATLAGALRRQVWIDQLHFQWTPNFYIVFVAPPGVVAKSTTEKVGMRLLKQVPRVNFGPQSMTWQALTADLAAARQTFQYRGEAHHMSALTIAVSELGTFLRPDDQALVDTLVDMWDGQLGEWGHSTKTQGKTIIVNPWMNIIGATTPAWLEANFPDVMIGGGLTSRIIFLFADKKRHFRAYPGLSDERPTMLKEEMALVHDLKIIADMKGEYKLTEEAVKWGEAWYKQHWETRDRAMSSERFNGWYARKQTHMHKLAMVLAASRSDKLEIDLETLLLAQSYIDGLEKKMLKVFDSIGVAPTAKHTNAILPLIKPYGKEGIPYDALYRMCYNTMTNQDFGEAINSAFKAKLLRLVSREGVKLVIYAGEEE